MARGDGVIGDENPGPVDPIADDQTERRRRERQADAARTSEWDERMDRLEEAAIQAEYATGREEATEEKARRNVFLRIGTIVVGFTVLLGGVAMMILPGPGILGILAGLGILSRELSWAERWMEAVKKRAKIEELKEQPKWVQVLTWTITAVAVIGSLVYFFVIR